MGQITSLRNQTIAYPYDKINSPNLVKFLFLAHEKSGLKPHREFQTYLREMKKFLGEVGGQKVIDLILSAVEKCDYAFGIDYLRRLNDESISGSESEDDGS